MSATDDTARNVFACGWCGAEQILLDLDVDARQQATAEWLAAHHDCNPERGGRICDRCNKLSPVRQRPDRKVIGLFTFNEQEHLDWLDNHECVTDQRLAWNTVIDDDDDTPIIVRHDGDPSKLPSMPPRPSWSSPDDGTTTRDGGGVYFSDRADFPLYGLAATGDGKWCEWPRVTVMAAREDGAGSKAHRVVLGLVIPSVLTPKPKHLSLDLPTARRVAAAILAAADLAETD